VEPVDAHREHQGQRLVPAHLLPGDDLVALADALCPSRPTTVIQPDAAGIGPSTEPTKWTFPPCNSTPTIGTWWPSITNQPNGSVMAGRPNG